MPNDSNPTTRRDTVNDPGGPLPAGTKMDGQHGYTSADHAPGDDDSLPFVPQQVSLGTLLKYAMRYRNDEPRLARVMLEIRDRDYSQHKEQVRALQWRWEYLVRSLQPPRWPDTAMAREDTSFAGRCFQCGEQGMLAFFGYRVGTHRGLLMPVRHHILDYIYKGRLPIVNDEAYTQTWGDPGSSHRLRRMASMISYLARNAMAHDSANYETAISEWEADLQYLKKMYFRPHENPDHDWDWPVLSAC